MTKKKDAGVTDFEKASRAQKKAQYTLRLYVAGVTRKSSAAIQTITAICDEYLKGRYSLEIIDIYKKPTLAKGEQIIAAPTLIKVLPNPLRKLIGDMADKKKVLLGLDIKPVRKKRDAEKKEKE